MKTKNSTWKIVLIVIAISIAVALMAVFGVQSYMNRAINMEEQVATAKSDVNVQEKRRVDLLGNLVDCIKNYDNHEYETLKAIVDGRHLTMIRLKKSKLLLRQYLKHILN